MSSRNALTALALVGIVALSFATAARAAEDAEHVTNQPAATLLLPYFEAQVPAKIGKKVNGVNTFFSINNSSASAAVAHVTIWSDLGVPVINFDVYLTGYDVQRISMVDILNGVLPLTADAGSDPSGKTSPKGPLSQDINFPGSTGPCASPATNYTEPLPTESIQHIRTALTGKQSPLFGTCFGLDHGDKKPIARGFVTVDSVTQCTIMNPNDAGYFAGGVADTRNILWGDYEIIDKSKKTAISDALVHVRSEANDPAVTDPSRYNFYSRFQTVAGTSFRQPLATKFAAHYVNTPEAKFATRSSLIVWRDPKSPAAPFTCGQKPPWFPLEYEEILAFDDQENVEAVPADSEAIGGATQKIQIDGPSFPISFAQGWLYLDLNATVAGVSVPAVDPTVAQSWVTVTQDNKGKFAGGTRAVPMDSATAVIHQLLN
jgi:hypothetical protein